MNLWVQFKCANSFIILKKQVRKNKIKRTSQINKKLLSHSEKGVLAFSNLIHLLRLNHYIVQNKSKIVVRYLSPRLALEHYQEHLIEWA